MKNRIAVLIALLALAVPAFAQRVQDVGTVRLGTMTPASYLGALRSHVKTDAGYSTAEYLLRNMHIASTETIVDLVSVSVAELGFPSGANLSTIYKAALPAGFNLCPTEVGPALRLQLEQTEPFLSIAMEPVRDQSGEPVVFTLLVPSGAFQDAFTVSSAEGRWPPESRLVFVRRRGADIRQAVQRPATVAAPQPRSDVSAGFEIRTAATYHSPFVKNLNDVQFWMVGVDYSDYGFSTKLKGRGTVTIDASAGLTFKVRRLFLAGGVTQPIHVTTIPTPGWDADKQPRGDNMVELHDGTLLGIDERSSLGGWGEVGLRISRKSYFVLGYSQNPYQLRFTKGTLDYGCNECGEPSSTFGVIEKTEIARSKLKKYYASLRFEGSGAGVLLTVSAAKNPFTEDSLSFMGVSLKPELGSNYRIGGNITLIFGKF